MPTSRLHALHILTQPKKYDSVRWYDDWIDDMIRLDILILDDDKVVYNMDLSSILYASTDFEDLIIKISKLYKEMGVLKKYQSILNKYLFD